VVVVGSISGNSVVWSESALLFLRALVLKFSLF
jgi:hypothetical protein